MRAGVLAGTDVNVKMYKHFIVFATTPITVILTGDPARIGVRAKVIDEKQDNSSSTDEDYAWTTVKTHPPPLTWRSENKTLPANEIKVSGYYDIRHIQRLETNLVGRRGI